MFRWFTRMMNIPLGDFARGDLVQAPWALAGQRVSTNICYEDLFGEELAASFADLAQRAHGAGEPEQHRLVWRHGGD